MDASRDPRRSHVQHIKTANTNPSLFHINNLITSYAKSNLSSEALHLFHQIPSPNVVSWTALISAFSNTLFSFHHFISMLRHPTLPNQHTLVPLFKTCATLSHLSFGRQLHSLSLKLFLSHLPFTGSSLVNFYSKCRLPEDAHKVFDRILERDEVCYASVIVGFVQNSEPTQALSMFVDMKAHNVVSTKTSVSGALRAAAELSALGQCRMIHSHAVVVGLDSDIVVGTSLIDGYGKTGVLFDARRAFDELLPNVNIVGWNAMMAAYAQQGNEKKVSELFNEMKHKGVVADDLTFLAILTACSNAGLVSEAEKWLNSMKVDYGLEPRLQHYTCVVGALARAGQLEDANNLTKTMPFEPDAAVWRVLLSASEIHGKTKMALEMGEKLLKMNSQDDSVRAILANVHAAAKSRDDVANIKKLMKVGRVTKELGRSWIEVRGEVHDFFAGDKRHERTSEIYDKLEEIRTAIEKLGYKEVVSDALLHEADVTDKKQALWYHSEKLAVAFGVLSGVVPPGKALRVVTNLRICKDCHKAFKFMSIYLEREIVVRDVNRHHSFHDGTCNCRDYW